MAGRGWCVSWECSGSFSLQGGCPLPGTHGGSRGHLSLATIRETRKSHLQDKGSTPSGFLSDGCFLPLSWSPTCWVSLFLCQSGSASQEKRPKRVGRKLMPFCSSWGPSELCSLSRDAWNSPCWGDASSGPGKSSSCHSSRRRETTPLPGSSWLTGDHLRGLTQVSADAGAVGKG